MLFARLVIWLIAFAAAGCLVCAESAEASSRAFRFPADAFAYANELSHHYELDSRTGKMVHRPRVPRPGYRLRCFVMARSARQFLQYARFEPNEPVATRASYRHLAGLVLARNPRRTAAAPEQIVIPGYRNLREFSAAHEDLLKARGGGAWCSYFQRGNWRMVFPISRRHQRQTADRLVAALRQDHPPVVHLVCFPSLTLNHAVLLYDFQRKAESVQFAVYDPNDPAAPSQLVFCTKQGRFHFPANDYFSGGPVKVYEVYRGLFY